MKKIITLLFILIALNVGLKAQVSVTSTGGATAGTHTTLSAAFTAINNGVYTGDVRIKIWANITETTSCLLNASGSGSASYTSVIVSPDDTVTTVKTISTSTSGIVLIDLNAAEFVLFDGRPMLTGTSKLLTFNNTVSTTTTNTTFRVRNGCFYVFAEFCNIINGASLTAGSMNVAIVNTAASFSNEYIILYNNDIKGGSRAVNIDGTNASTYQNMKDIYVSHNNIFDFGLYGVLSNLNVSTLAIDSNNIYHSSTFSSNSTASSTRGVYIAATVDTGYYFIGKNRIYNLKTSFTSLFAMYVQSSTIGNLSYIPIMEIENNSISLLETNNSVSGGAIGGLNGITFAGANPLDLRIIENTIRLGGSSNVSVTTSAVRSVGVGKFNSHANSTFTMLNNIIINDRFGPTPTTAGAYSAHMAVWINTNTTGVNTLNYNNYTGYPYFAGWGGTIYGSIAGYQAAATPNESNSISKNVTFANTIDPYLSGTSISDADLMGTPISIYKTDIDYNTRDTVAPYKGAHESVKFNTNDLSSIIVYTYGRIPIGTNDIIRADIKNTGVANVSGGVASLYIKGANNMLLNATIPTLAPGLDTVISFPAYTPTNLGFDTIYCVVPIDQNGTNDTAIWIRENTVNALSYSRPYMNQSGNVGNNGQGEIVAKFYTPIPNAINQVNVNFTNTAFNGPFPFQIVLYGDSGGNAGPTLNPIWVSNTQQTINGVFNLSLPSIPVNGYFYVGVRQVSVNNIGFAYQIENPIRDYTFYFRQATTFSTSIAWNDFAVYSGNTFRFMIEPRLKVNYDVGVTSILEPGISNCAGGLSNKVKVEVENLGIVDQILSSSNILTVSGTVKRPGGSTFNFNPVNITSGSILVDSTLNVILNNAFAMDTPGVYTFTTWARTSNDFNSSNDTMPPFNIEVFKSFTVPNTQKFDSVLTAPIGWVCNRFAGNAGSGTSSSNSMRVNLNNGAAFFANASIRSPKFTNLTANSSLRFEYKITDATTNTATVLNNTDSIKIMVSTNCGSSFTMVALIIGSGHNPSTNYQTYQLNLAAYAGQNIMVRIDCDWFGTSNNANLDIDNFRIINPTNDVAVKSLIQPCLNSIISTASVTPKVGISNVGLTAISNIPVLVQITGPINFNTTGTITTSTAAGANATVTCNTGLILSTPGTYTAKIFTALTNDDDRFNDTLTSTFVVTDINLGDSALRAVMLNTTNYMTAPGNGSLNITGNAMTIEAWVYSTNIPQSMPSGANILTKDSLQYGLMIDPLGYLKYNVKTSNGYNSLTSNTALPLATWSHIAAEYNGTTMSMFINGNFAGQVNMSGNISSSSSPVTIGRFLNNLSGFSGYIDEVRVWNTARSVDEIRSNMHYRFDNASNPNLMAYWRFDEATPGSSYVDASGNCNALTIPSSTTISSINADFPLSKNVVVAKNIISQSGSYTFANTRISVDLLNYIGTDSIYIHKFNGYSKGVSPVTSPGGVTAIYPNYWNIYKYGSGSIGGMDVYFNLGSGSFNSSAANSDFNLFSRQATGASAWNIMSNVANNVDFTNQKIDFYLNPTGFSSVQLTVGALNQTLPVNWLSFNAKIISANAQLYWSTATEINNQGFNIERSTDGKNFVAIAFVKGALNSKSIQNYSYNDLNIFNSQNQVWYRIKQIDVNGKGSYSSIVTLTNKKTSANTLQVIPNPFHNEFKINLPTSESTQLELLSMDGKTLLRWNGINTTGFNCKDLPAGIYLLRLNDGINSQSIKVIKD